MSNFFKTALQWPTAIYQSGKRTTATLSFLAIFVVILIQLHAILDVPLLPVFELSFTSIRQVAHLLLDWIIFSWLLWILQAIHFVFTLPFSFPVLPTFPDWGVPPLLKDASIASIVLVRAFEIAYLIVPQADRDSARDSTTAAQWVSIRRAQGPIATNIHLFVEALNKGMYRVKDILVNVLAYPWRFAGFAPNNPMESATNKFVREVVLGALMIGYVRFIGYLCFSFAWGVDAFIVNVSRKTFVFFLTSLVVALVIAGLFFWTNGYVCSRLADDSWDLAVRLLGVCKVRL